MFRRLVLTLTTVLLLGMYWGPVLDVFFGVLTIAIENIRHLNPVPRIKYYTALDRAEAGDINAQMEVADTLSNSCTPHHHGHGGHWYPPCEITTVFKWHRIAVARGNVKTQGHLEAILNLSGVYGLDISGDVNGAIEWYKASSAKGNVNTSQALAFIYMDGAYVPQNYDEAAKWAKKAAEQGSTWAQENLDKIYASKKSPQPVEQGSK